MTDVEEHHNAPVAALLRLLEKSLRAVSLSLPDQVVYQQTMEKVALAFAAYWADHPVLVVQVRENGLVYQDELVLPVGSRAESLAWPLFAEGVRTLVIAPGAEWSEIAIFLQAVHRSRLLTEEDADDLLTLLWAAEFERIKYQVVESPQEKNAPVEASGSGPEGTPDEVLDRVRQEVGDSSNARSEGVANLEEFDSTLYFLDKSEIDYLRREIDREYQQNLGANVLSMLFDIFELHTETDTRSEILEILEELLPHLLNQGDFRSVAYLITEARLLLKRAPEMITEHRKVLDTLTRRLSGPEAVVQILQALDDAPEQPSLDELAALFEELKPEALETVLKWLRRLSNGNARALLTQVVDKMALAHPKTVARALTSPERSVVLEALRLVTKLRLVDTVDELGALTQHRDVGVRTKLVEALRVIGTGPSMEVLLGLMRDVDPDVRVAAVTALGARKYHASLGPIREAAFGKDICDRDLSEKRALFTAFSALAGEQGVAPLKAVLVGKGFGVGRGDSETRACATAALGSIQSKAARVVLQRAASDKDPVVRYAAARALQGDEA